MEKKYLGIDWGEKRIGLALGDSVTKTATPFKVVASLGEVLKVIAEEGIDVLVVGEPKTLSNKKGETQKKSQEFFDLLKTKLEIPIEKVDERYSSSGADALSGKGKKNKRSSADRDALAAMIILQNYLDKISNS